MPCPAGAGEVTIDAAAADIVVLGKIVSPYGVRGAVRVFPFADDPAAWSALPCWWLGRDGDAPHLWQRTVLVKAWRQQQLLIAELASITDRTAAEGLRGLLVGVPRVCLPPTERGEYYWDDLLGLAVTNTQGAALGRVVGLLDTPANAVLRVGDDQGDERLLPFVAAVVLDVDLTARVVRVAWEADW